VLGSQRVPLSGESLAGLAARYAPVVVLHAEDRLRPCSAEWFLERSDLRWASGRSLGGVGVADVGRTVAPSRLGASAKRPYRHTGYVASTFTRPLEAHSTRPADLALEQGFFVRLRTEAAARGHDGVSADGTRYRGATTYWDHDKTTASITYWLYYAASAPPLGILRAGEQLGTEGPPTEAVPEEIEAADAAAKLEEFHRAYPHLAAEVEPEEELAFGDVIERLKVVAEGVRALLREDDVLHEGDWERVTVYLDERDPEGAAPASVGFYRHSTTTFLRWDRVEKDGSHPVAYAAIGSHASLPEPGFGFIDVGDRDGPRWQTADELERVEEAPWYGFGGAWGRVGKVRESTGPVGPGAHWKHPAPRPA
jgi:hypothetical protein